VSDLPVVAVIDRALPNVVSRVRRIGCRGYMVRPVRSAALKGMIERLAPVGTERASLPIVHT
jgi:AmiR/NasT family two-component response regulator